MKTSHTTMFYKRPNNLVFPECKYTQIQNRDGCNVPFDAYKIYMAIKNGATVTGEFDDTVVLKLTNIVIETLNSEFKDASSDDILYIEHIQDTVEKILIGENYPKTAKSYILYRDNRTKIRNSKSIMVDVESSMNEYLRGEDWRIHENSNQGYSIGGLILSNSGKITANYWLSYIYPTEIGMAHRNGDYHIHDLTMFSGYCAGWSLRMLIEEGFNCNGQHVQSSPAKHLSTICAQMINFFGTLQNEWAGAQAFSSVDTYLAGFVRKDNLNYDQVKQAIQGLVYNLNVPSRWGTQTPFTNFTFDMVCPTDLRDNHPIIGGEEMPFTFGELQKEMDMINEAYVEVMTAGDASGATFTFPIPTYNITKDFDWNSKIANKLFEMTAKYGTPYFQNFINSDLKPGDVRSMCCRLQLDLRELLKRGGGLFGSAEQTGSIGVVTINCARLGYLFKGNEKSLYYRLDYLLELAKQSLEIKRKVLTQQLENGLYPFTKRYLGRFNNHFSTIGVNGVNEMIRNFTDDKENITTSYGLNFAEKLLLYIREKMVQFQEETGHLYNLEATPAEGTCYRFAKEDIKRYPDIIQAGFEGAPYYTNSTQIPVSYTNDPFVALDLQDKLQTKYTGGTVLHLYMSEKISSGEACKKLVKTVLSNYRLPYITVTPTFSVCPIHGYIAGEHEYCPKCDAEIEKKKKSMCCCEHS